MMMLRDRLEEVMYGRRNSPFFEALLNPLAKLYGAALLLRNGLYRVGIRRPRNLQSRVISVGNLTLGGTGKTPAVMQIAQVLLRNGRKPAVISRGYGRRDESAITVVADGTRVCVDAGTGGDEPLLIGSRLKTVPVVAGSNRFRAASLAEDSFGIDTVILDDGFQHLRLRRDLDVVLVDAADPFGKGKLFPAGILREPLSALRRAHAVLITHADRTTDVERLKKTIQQHTRARVFTSRPVPVDLVDIMTGESKPLAALQATSVLAFAGIARPDFFLAMLRSLKAEIGAEFRFPDHYAYTRSDLVRIFRRAADARVSMIVTTEKDAVRLRDLGPEGIWACRIEFEVLEKAEWEAVLLNQA